MPLDIPDSVLTDDALSAATGRAQAALARHQRPDGHWVFDLEADATIPAEIVASCGRGALTLVLVLGGAMRYPDLQSRPEAQAA